MREGKRKRNMIYISDKRKWKLKDTTKTGVHVDTIDGEHALSDTNMMYRRIRSFVAR